MRVFFALLALLLPGTAFGYWECTNPLGVTYFSDTPLYCAQYYPNCTSVANVGAGCLNPNLKKKLAGGGGAGYQRQQTEQQQQLEAEERTTTVVDESPMEASPKNGVPTMAGPDPLLSPTDRKRAEEERKAREEAQRELARAEMERAQLRESFEALKTEHLQFAAAAKDPNFKLESLGEGLSDPILEASRKSHASLSGFAADDGTALGSSGRSPASKVSQAAARELPFTGKAAEDPWLGYMAQTSAAALKEQLASDPGIRERFRKKLEEMKRAGKSMEMIGLLSEILEDAEELAADDRLADLSPLSVQEAFSMDEDETRTQIRRMLAELEESQASPDPQFLPQQSLFERISVAHQRSLARGSLKLRP